MDVFSEYVIVYSQILHFKTLKTTSPVCLTQNCNGVIYLDISTEMCEIGPTF